MDQRGDEKRAADGLEECNCNGSRILMDNQGIEWVRSNRLAALTGLSVKAIDRKRGRDIWKEGTHFQRRDGGVYYSIKAYNAWANGRPSGNAQPTFRRVHRNPR